MENKKLKWCFKLREGLRIVEPNERLAKSYLEEAKSSLERAEKNFNDGDLLWTTVVVYYAEYYALYSFLQRIGIKCENHSCSILATTFLLGEEKTKIINNHKNKRIDAQYYMKVGKEEEVKQILMKAKVFVSMFCLIPIVIWTVAFCFLTWGGLSEGWHFVSLSPFILILPIYFFVWFIFPCPKTGGSDLVCNAGILISIIITLIILFLLGWFVGSIIQKRRRKRERCE